VSKDCYQQILDIYDEFPKQQKKIADFYLTNFPEVLYYSVSKCQGNWNQRCFHRAVCKTSWF
jgi:hypothetical protein